MNKFLTFVNHRLFFYIFVLCLTLFYSVVFTFSEFYSSPYSDFKDFIILFMQWSCISIAIFGLLCIISINKYIFAIIFPLLTIICAIITYFRYTLNVALTPMIIDLIVVNDIRTGMELVSFTLLIFVLFCAIFSIFCVWLRYNKIKLYQWYWPLIIGLTIIIFINGIYKLSRPVYERIPFSIYYNLKKYIDERHSISTERISISDGVICDADSLIVVFVLGESLRADHIALNGYNRNTTPFLSNEKNLISIPAIYSEYYFTHLSIPHILTRADSITTQRAFNEESFISIFSEAGYRTSWLANQESVVSYIYFMKESDTLIYANRGKSMYVFDKWLDADLLPIFDNELKHSNPKKLLILHTIGSHWWYNSHYPKEFEYYKPVMKSKTISNCTKQEIINSYDNSILYTDYIINEFIKKLKDKKSILIYLSDHGESLGENGLYIHSTDNPILHNPACLIWYSEKYQKSYPKKIESLHKNALKHYRTDFLFHTIIDVGDIKTPYKINNLNILNTN